jgi:large subunit ribosomal protein L12
MNLVYGALLLHSAGKEINEDGIKKVAEATGDKVEDAQVKALVAALDGVNIEEAISKAAVPVAAPAVAADEGKGEEKKEEKNEEDDKKKQDEAAAGLGSLFG